jgi:hypothetical protein
MRKRYLFAVALTIGSVLGWLTASGQLSSINAAEGQKAAKTKLDRKVLPIPEPKSAPISTRARPKPRHVSRARRRRVRPTWSSS